MAAFLVVIGLAALVYPPLILAWHAHANEYVGQPVPGPLYPLLAL